MTLLLLACDTGPDRPERLGPPDDTGGRDSGDAPPEDHDGDGSFTGDDCDDDDPTRHPGAADACDAVDQDCDGNPVGEGACSERFGVGETTAIGWFEGEGVEDGNRLGLYVDASEGWGRNADFDGDGIVDILALHKGGPVLLIGGLPAPGQSITGVWLGGWTFGQGFNVAGDFDGDGWNDLLLTTGENGGEAWVDGGVSVRLGPPSRWGGYQVSFTEGADASWVHANGEENFGRWSDAADLTGDGLSDIVVFGRRVYGLPDDDEAPLAYLRVLLGRTSGLPVDLPIAEEEPSFRLNIDFGSDDRLAILPDIDGDGIGELAFQVPGALGEGSVPTYSLAIVPTEVLTPAFTGQELTELWTPIPNGDDIDSVDLIDEPNALGDVDGDGYGDVALTVYDTDRLGALEICTAVLRGGADLAASTTSDQLGGRVCFLREYDGQINQKPGYPRVVPDTDGDGVADLYWSKVPVDLDDYQSDRMSCVMPTAELPAAGQAMVGEVRKFCFGSSLFPQAYQNYTATDLADLDEDGRPELLVSEPDWGDMEQGRILVVPGFEIPWDDPTRW